MIAELGHFALVLVFFVALAQMLPATARQAAISCFWLVSIAFLALLHAFALSDFSVLVVASNSNTMKPLAYKLTALWGNHEGSLLLWLWLMTGWGAIYARRAATPLTHTTLLVQGLLTAGMAGFALLTSNPFRRLDPSAPEGLDLNPVLQDPLLIIHPPFLYIGVTGFSIVFALAVAALWRGRADAGLARDLRVWTLLSWAALTVGITLGSFWAYYELGWGGFWFWDPVENVSLLPWLAGCALLHSLRALERRGSLPGWTLLLALLPFSFGLFGTFLVRSGLLTSVHAFAADPMRGIFLLALTTVVVGGALAVYAFRAPRMAPGAPFSWFSRDAAVLANNVFMCVALTTVFLGTAYPLILAALDVSAVSVGAPYYIAIFAPLLLPFAAMMGVAPMLAWRQTPPASLRKAIRLPLLFTGCGVAGLFLSPAPVTPLVLAGFTAGFWITAATVADVLHKSGNFRRPRQLTRGHIAMTLGHLGFAALIIGATAATQWVGQETLWMKPGQRVALADHTILLLGIETGLGRNFNADRGIFAVQPQKNPAAMFFMTPEKRFYPVQERTTSESALALTELGILYVVLGDQDAKNPSRWVVRVYHHPLVVLVFMGGALMALGGGLAAFDRKGSVT